MTILARSLHTTDEHLDGRECRRTIRNWANYRTPAGLWLPSVPGLVEREVGIGRRGFRLAQVDAPLQAFVGDGAVLAVRDSRCVDRWASLTPVGTDPRSRPHVDGARIAWRELWPRAELAWTVCANRVEKLITLREPGHPAAFRFGLDLGPGQRARVVAGRLFVGDDRGSWLWTKPAWAADALGRPVRVGLRLDVTALVIEPDAEDLRRAAYPVVVDPTATISGTSAIDDNMLYSSSANGNFGGSAYLAWKTGTYKSIVRATSASLPSGTHTAFRWLLYHPLGNAQTLSAYFVADANAGWVEGSQNGLTESNASCWNYAQYTAQAWAGSAGCSTSGTDYDADASPPTLALLATATWYTFTLRASWSQSWKNATRANAGIVVNGDSSLNTVYAYSSNSGTSPLYFEIDYAAAGAAAPILAYLRRRMRS